MSYFNYNNKKIYYEEIGEGIPLLLLHGNTLSSKMFNPIIDFYKSNNRVVLIDFLGHGKSDRVENFPIDFWYNEAMQIIAFLEEKMYNNVNLIGTSGGALVALNVILERPDLVNKVVADSFEGENLNSSNAESIGEERKIAKLNNAAIDFWGFNHGQDWEQVIDNDTNMIIEYSKSMENFFHKSLEQVQVPVLFTASKQDELIKEVDEIVKYISKKTPNSKIHLFEKGGHPAIISNAIEFADIAEQFLHQ